MTYATRIAQSANFELEGVYDSYLPEEGCESGLKELDYTLGACKDTVTLEIDGVTVYATDLTVYTDGERIKAVWVAGEDEDGKYFEDIFVEFLPVTVAQVAQHLFAKAKKASEI